MEIISRKEAKERGLTYYFTGKPCRRGHVEKRLTSAEACVACLKSNSKKFLEANPEKQSSYNKKHYYKNPEASRGRVREHIKKKREKAATRPRPEKCELCGEIPVKKSLAWDHNHETGEFRGWLCGPCNLALGYVRDNPELLERMATYVRNNGISTMTCEEL